MSGTTKWRNWKLVARALATDGLDHRARCVLLLLCEHAQPDGTGTCPSQATMMERMDMKERAVRYGLESLLKGGMIRKTGYEHGGRHHPPIYAINIDMLAEIEPPPPPQAQQQRVSFNDHQTKVADGATFHAEKVAKTHGKVAYAAIKVAKTCEKVACGATEKDLLEKESPKIPFQEDREHTETRRAASAPLPPPAAEITALTQADSNWCVVVDGDDVESGGDGGIDIAPVRRAHAKDAQVVAALAYRTWQQRADALADVYEERWWNVPHEQRAAFLDDDADDASGDDASGDDGDDDAMSEQRDTALMAARYRVCGLPYIHIRRRRHWRQSGEQHHALDEDESEYLTA